MDNFERHPHSLSPEDLDVDLPSEETEEPPATPEDGSYERRLLDEINKLIELDNQRAAERFKGAFNNKWLGKVNEWFHRAGHREISENLMDAGIWKENPKWKKWLEIGLKFGGGAGAAVAVTMTGGVGLLLTPLVWSASLQNAIDGVLQGGEQLVVGKNRDRAEVASQTMLTEAIEAAKAELMERGEELGEEEFADMIIQMQLADNNVIYNQETNMQSEQKWNFGRKLVSGVATVATGIFGGVPLGVAGAGQEATKVGATTSLDVGHRTFWNALKGHFFTYNNIGEVARVTEEVSKHNYIWNTIDTVFRQSGHVMGEGLGFLNKLAIGGTLAHVVTRIWGSRPKEISEENEVSPWDYHRMSYEPSEDLPESPEEEEYRPQPDVFEAPRVEDRPVEPILPQQSEVREPLVSPEAPIIWDNLTPPENSSQESGLSPEYFSERPSSVSSSQLPQEDYRDANNFVLPERMPEEEMPDNDFYQIKEDIKEKKGLFKYFERRQLEKKFETKANLVLNHLAKTRHGLNSEGELDSRVRDEFSHLIGLDASKFRIMTNKYGLYVEIRWNLV